MSILQIAEILVGKGMKLWKSSEKFGSFSGVDEADELICDLKHTPHAYIIGCVMDRQIKSEMAWSIPYQISSKLGSFDFDILRTLSLEDFENLMTSPDPLHRFPIEMSRNFYFAIQKIAEKYNGLASNLWNDKPSSAEVVYRFLEFRGVGQKIATMATNILARDFKIEFSDYYSIDVSVDIHIRRVFSRLGLVPPKASNEQIIYRARALSPKFPGLLDLPAWEIGRKWCKPKDPNCSNCYMNQICSKNL